MNIIHTASLFQIAWYWLMLSAGRTMTKTHKNEAFSQIASVANKIDTKRYSTERTSFRNTLAHVARSSDSSVCGLIV